MDRGLSGKMKEQDMAFIGCWRLAKHSPIKVDALLLQSYQLFDQLG